MTALLVEALRPLVLQKARPGRPALARLANEAFLWAVEHNIGPHAVNHGEPDTAGTDATVLSGIPVSAGSYTGPARIIHSESEFDRLQPGDVLVCLVASPVWSVLGTAGIVRTVR